MQPLARQAGLHSLRHTVGRESLYQLDTAQVRPAALVLIDVSQTQGQDGRAIHRQFRRIGRQGGSQTRRRNRGLGHIHQAEMREIDGILYCNDGDWVESCTSLVEDMDGRLRLIDWPKMRERVKYVSVEEPVVQAA